jgi:hypothetical protein
MIFASAIDPISVNELLHRLGSGDKHHHPHERGVLVRIFGEDLVELKHW